MTLCAPAKINLSLSVLGKRPDGFHAIESHFVTLTLADTLTLEAASESGIAFTCSDATLPCDDSNLVVRAARRFFETARIPAAVRIHLAKAIPHGAGLGGGSSDAAATLRGLNALHGAPLAAETLHALAAELGSDVPFFLAGGSAVCRGRGELIEPLPFPTPLPLLLVKPPFGVPTPWAYSRWRDSHEIPGVPYAPQRFPWGTLVNGLERPVFEKYLFLAVLKRWLLQQPEAAGALMSGSGSTCFAVLRNETGGPALEARAKEQFGDVWTCLCRTRAA
ncbi:MAG: 4-(cytidine 5'-diphospho)-2-C-methyl-D-erythritol kinase [Chthoniobacteraceae bacterium]|nr:4-(cytidine 5'-diphospho)-2-C-methyl-D-erythritol kinase [Chthoniobacteraceae bacterium]